MDKGNELAKHAPEPLSTHDDGKTGRRPRGHLATWPQAVPVLAAVLAVVVFGCLARDATILGEVLTFCLAVLVLLRFPGITKLKALGLEVEVKRAVRARHEAERAADEAQATAAQLRTVALTLGRLSLGHMGLFGRFGGSWPLVEKGRLRDEVIRSLTVAGCSPQELEEAAALLNRTIRFDLASRVLSLAGQLPQARGEAFSTKVQAFLGRDARGSWILGTEHFASPSASEVRALLAEVAVDDSRVLRRLREYERYEADGTVPDIEPDSKEEDEFRAEVQRR